MDAETHSTLKYDEVTCYVGTVAKESTACSNHNPTSKPSAEVFQLNAENARREMR